MSQSILLTGASGGFGRLTATTLLAAGHRLVATMRDPAGRNQPYFKALTELGAHVVEMDVCSDLSVQNAVDATVAHFGGELDVVINNAGWGVHGLQECFTSADWQRVFDVNVFGVARVNRAALPTLRAQRAGLLIHISSLLGRVVMPFYGPYNASKWALEALAENYRVELATLGIDSVVVEPGGYNTEFASNLLHPSDDQRAVGYGDFAAQPESMLKSFLAMVAATPQQDPQRVADAIVHLISLPPGQRPFRTAVDFLGMQTVIDPYNAMLESLHRSLYGSMGLGTMLDRNLNAY